MKHILFLATAFPESETEFKGIFIKDYLLSIKDQFQCSIYVFRICSSRKGFYITGNPNYTVFRYALYSHKVFGLLKYLSYPVFLLAAFYHLRKINRPDIIHIHGSLFIAGAIGLLYGKMVKRPVIYTEHMGRFEQYYQKLYLKSNAKWLLDKFSIITCVSSFTKSKIIAIGIPEVKIRIINNPVDTELFDYDNTVIRENTIAFVGRLDENKGILRCIKAFSHLFEKYPDLRLLIIGDGNQRELVEAIINKNPALNQRVELTGLLEKKNIAPRISLCRFLAAPSIIESFGIAVAEAMSCGLPVIVGKNNGTSDFVDEKVGLIINPESISELTNAMEWLILNGQKFDPLLIRSRINDNFSLEATGRKLSALYHSVN